MKDFMTALPVIFVQLTCSGDQRALHPQTGVSAFILHQPVQLPVQTDSHISKSKHPVLPCKLKKGAQFQVTCNLCRESHKTQVWLCFLVLSFLSTSTCSAYGPVEDLQNCLEKVKHTIEKSDAMLYAPSTNDIKEKCRTMTLKCYMLELLMVLDEEDIVDDDVDCIIAFNETLPSEKPEGCPPCEAYSLRNVTVFLGRLNHLLEERSACWMSDQT